MPGIYSYLKKYRKKRRLNALRQYFYVPEDTCVGDEFNIDARHPLPGKKYLVCGHHDILDCSFVFETSGGKVTIGDRVHIGQSTFISVNQIVIGDDVTIAWDCLIYDHNSHSVNWEERKNDTEQEYADMTTYQDPIRNKDWSAVKSAPITICDKAWIGVGCKILKGVTIGEGAVVGAGSVVAKDVEPWTMVGGNPARVLKKLK